MPSSNLDSPTISHFQSPSPETATRPAEIIDQLCTIQSNKMTKDLLAPANAVSDIQDFEDLCPHDFADSDLLGRTLGERLSRRHETLNEIPVSDRDYDISNQIESLRWGLPTEIPIQSRDPFDKETESLRVPRPSEREFIHRSCPIRRLLYPCPFEGISLWGQVDVVGENKHPAPISTKLATDVWKPHEAVDLSELGIERGIMRQVHSGTSICRKRPTNLRRGARNRFCAPHLRLSPFRFEEASVVILDAVKAGIENLS